MSSKKKLSELIEAADSETLKHIADSHPMVSDKKKDELYARISKRTHLSEEYADRVSGVEVRHGRGVSRYVGLVAAMALVIGGLGGGGLLLKQRAGSVPSSEIEATTEVTEAETETEAPTEAAELTEEEAQAIVDDLFVKFTDFKKAYLLGGIEVDYSAPIYRTYVPVGAPDGYEATEKFYPVIDERFRKWEDVEAACLEVFTEEAGYPIIGFKSKDEPFDTVCGINETITNGTTHIIDGSDWYVIWDMKFKTKTEWIGEPRIEITPDGNIEAYRKRHITSIAYKEFQNCTTRQEQMNLDPATLTPFEVEEDSHDLEEVFTIINTDNGWRIAKIENALFREHAENDTEQVDESDNETVAIAEELTDKYLEYYRKLSGDGLEVDTSVTLEKSETDDAGRVYSNTYYLITDEDYPSNERIYSMFSEACSDVIKDELYVADADEWCYFNASNFLQKDESWYILKERYENVGTISDWKDKSLRVEADGNNIKAIRTYRYSSAKNEYDVEVYFTIGKTDDGWRITDFTKQQVFTNQQVE
ncbi:MAG: hypothetical protein J6Y64_11275 [Ruminococcus sp.]|nr:hypothetical protein [Ruminococcus sp.]